MVIRNLIRVAIVFAGVAFFFSFLMGLLAGASFGGLILRAFLFAVIFAGLGVGIYFIYNKFLKVDSFPISSDEQKETFGRNVDIVSSDDNLSFENLTQESDLFDENATRLDEVSSGIDFDSIEGLGGDAMNLDELAENFSAIGNSLDTSSKIGYNSGNSKEFSGISALDESFAPSFANGVTLDDIGGSGSSLQDYAKAVRTMVKKGE